MTTDDYTLISALESLVVDLYWMSETDALFQVLYWPDAFQAGFSTAELLERTHHNSQTPIDCDSLESFLKPALQLYDWYGDPEREIAKRYQDLLSWLLKNLSQIQVWRIGYNPIDLYILGQTSTAHWMGLSTQAVET